MGGDVFMQKTKLKRWEAAMLLALCVFFCAGVWAEDVQTDLAGHLVRLHVIANSDSPADQAAKLQMRDRVLALLSPLLAECSSREEAVDIILTHQEQLEALGDISVELGEEYYPTRNYEGFSLPAGEYLSLRVVMGAGRGHNWWCVVFPPLCTEALTKTDVDAFSLLAEDETGLVTQANTGYILRFRIIEWWDALCRSLQDTGFCPGKN